MSSGNQEKTRLHPRNKNRERYDLKALINSNPELKQHLKFNKYGIESINFSNPLAVKVLNKALLNYYYGIKNWEFSDENLCPPIPGRADYIHYLADLLSEQNTGKIPTGANITCLDIGIGATCIYPIIGVTTYGWKFIGSDVSPTSIASSQKIIDTNPSLKELVECRLQLNLNHIFNGIITPKDKIDITLCNPPFHASFEEAQKGTRRKIKNLSGKKAKKTILNFSGANNELIYEGGEYNFIQKMIKESKLFAENCCWFSTLVSKQAHLKLIYSLLEKVGAIQTKTIELETGNKTSRIIAWTFLSVEAQKEWMKAKN